MNVPMMLAASQMLEKNSGSGSSGEGESVAKDLCLDMLIGGVIGVVLLLLLYLWYLPDVGDTYITNNSSLKDPFVNIIEVSTIFEIIDKDGGFCLNSASTLGQRGKVSVTKYSIPCGDFNRGKTYVPPKYLSKLKLVMY